MENVVEKLSQVFPQELAKEVAAIYRDFKMLHEAEGGSQTQEMLRGHRITPGFSAEPVEYAMKEWSFREGDVLLASYPKTGTNWTLSILNRLLHQDSKDYEMIKMLPVHLNILEAGSVKKFSVLDKLPMKRRVIGTHLPPQLVNMDNLIKSNAKVVYVLRNPKDQIVSFFHFFRKMAAMSPIMRDSPMMKAMEDWNTYFNAITSGSFPTHMKEGEWYPEHVLSWWKEKQNKNVYFLYYEDLKKDFSGELRRLAEFLDVELSAERAEQIAEQSTLGSMKNEALQSQNQDLKKFQLANMRKGEIGGWKEYLTVAQSEAIDAQMEEKLGHTDVRFTYE